MSCDAHILLLVAEDEEGSLPKYVKKINIMKWSENSRIAVQFTDFISEAKSIHPGLQPHGSALR